MSLDLRTLFVIAIFASTVAGLLLLLSWLQTRNVRALAWWAAAFIIGAVGVVLIAVRGDIPDIWSIGIANAIIAAAYGIMWGGVRNFEGHPTSVPLMLAGAAIWLLACQVEEFFATPQARVALMSAIVFVYSAFSAWEFWQGRDERLIWRLPIVVLLGVHAAFFIIRIPLAGALSLPTGSGDIHVGWWIFIIFEAMFFSICISYLLGGVARERIVLWYKHASLIDPLTGVGNRRAFLERGEKLLHRTASDQQPAVLLFFDLDKFKNVNDTFGHHVGDRLLTAFCGVATNALRPGDLFGRLGGEEFASLLPQTSLNEGLDVAERIRANFEATMLEVDANTLAATVSVGVAMSTDQNRDLAGLLTAADRALYRAKANGRNRVEYARAGPEVRIESVKAGTRECRRRWRNGAYDREASAPRITGQELRSRSAD
jgi:diguanylate cyclase (GGDEF)-like protein